MKRDIENRTDIELLVNNCYEEIIADKRLAFALQEIVKVKLSDHLPSVYNFCENIILYTGNYEANPVNLFKNLYDITQLNKSLFDHSSQVFIRTTDELFKGKKANIAKQRAVNMSFILKQKILEYQQRIEKIY